MLRLTRRLALILLASTAPAATEAPRGWNEPGFQPVTAARIAAELPPAEQAPWSAYLAESARRRALNDSLITAELAMLGREKVTPPPAARGTPLPLKNDAAWYAGPEARALADHVLSYQTPAGGWNKAVSFSRPRAPGEDFGRETRYRGTFDNDATVPQIRFLALVAHAAGDAGAAYRDGFVRGLEYVFAAQFPNGGWPQIYPLSGGYHDSLTFNDNMTAHLLGLLRDTAAGTGALSIAPPELRIEAARRFERGLSMLLATQVRIGGEATAWGQQHDALTLEPCAARNFEPASLSSAESAKLVEFLMTVEPRRPAITAAIEAAAAWMERTRIMNHAWTDPDGQGRRLVPTPGAGPLWSRLYEIGTDKPIFGDRDKTIHYAIEEVSRERRDGYSWFDDGPATVLRRLPAWRSRASATP